MGVFKAQVKNKSGKSVGKSANIRLNYSAPDLQRHAAALLGNIYGYGNAGKFRNRFYSLDDNTIGVDTYSRELLVRWCRELDAQLPVVKTAKTTLSDFTIGGDRYYIPEYTYKRNDDRGKYLVDWIVNTYYLRCCTRGSAYHFQKCKTLQLETMYTDGDLLKIYGQDKDGFPMVQYIPTNRIKSGHDNYIIPDGAYKDCIITDGVVCTPQGQVIAHCIQNSQNLVTNYTKQSEEVIYPVGKADLFADFSFFDKPRGLPKVGFAVLQAMSIQELDSYLMDKLKIESLIGLIEATPTGEAPQELQDTLKALVSNTNATGNTLQLSPQDHALEVKQGPDIRYVKANGGDIKALSSNTPSDQMGSYMTRLEQQILSVMGVPHQVLFSLQQAGGRITSAPANIFRATVDRMQGILDKDAKKEVAIAVAKGLKNGLIPGKNGEPLDFDPDENLLAAFEFTHPPKFSLDQKYDNDIVLENLEAGVITYNDACKQLSNKTSQQVFTEQADDQVLFYKEAQRVSKETGRDLEKVIAEWRKSSLKVTNTMTTEGKPDEK